MSNFLLDIVITTSIFSLLTLSLNLQYGLTGLLNFGQVWFFAIGAYVSAVSLRTGIPIWLELFIVMGMGIAAGWGLSLPTRRLKQDYWALTAFAVAEIFRLVMQDEAWIAGGSIGTMGILPLAPPTRLAVILVALVGMTFLIMERIRRSPFGRAMRVVREDELMAASIGRDVYSIQVRVMMLGGAVAALSGFFYAHYLTYVGPDEFLPLETFLIWIMLILGGRGNNLGAIFGAVILEAISTSTRFAAGAINVPPILLANLRTLTYGLLLVLLVVYRQRGALVEPKQVFDLSHRGSSTSPAGASSYGSVNDKAASVPGPMLRIQEVCKRFGGIQALTKVSMRILPDKITGIIGPNGSGKSTLFNLICAVFPMDSGMVYLGSARVDTSRPDLVARQGIIRTFQTPKVALEMTVLENLLFGPMCQRGELLGHLFAPTSNSRLAQEERHYLTKAEEVMSLLNIHHMANEYAATLSGGQSKLLSLAIALMADPKVMLLDEPVAGVNPIIIQGITDTLRELRSKGRTLAIIEHNMQVVAGLCDHVYVLDVGELIAEGTPDDVRRDPAVVAAYLGTRIEAIR